MVSRGLLTLSERACSTRMWSFSVQRTLSSILRATPAFSSQSAADFHAEAACLVEYNLGVPGRLGQETADPGGFPKLALMKKKNFGQPAWFFKAKPIEKSVPDGYRFTLKGSPRH